MHDRLHRHDLIVVGAGSAGYAAARTARGVGCDVALVDRGPLGGLCILRGCMPSKTFLASSDALQDAREARALGIDARGFAVDMPFIAARKRELVRGFADYRIEGIEEFPLYLGGARFLSPTRLAVGDDVLLEASKFVIATGSVVSPSCSRGLPKPATSIATPCWSSRAIPDSVIVLGGGYTACELGQFLARMGAKVTMLIRSSHLLTQSDDDIGDALTEYFREEGIDVVTHATAVSRGAPRRQESRAAIYAKGRSGKSSATRYSTRSAARPISAASSSKRPASRTGRRPALRSTAVFGRAIRTSMPSAT